MHFFHQPGKSLQALMLAAVKGIVVVQVGAEDDQGLDAVVIGVHQQTLSCWQGVLPGMPGLSRVGMNQVHQSSRWLNHRRDELEEWF